MNKVSDQQMAQAEKQAKLWESMINSMTPHERRTPEVLASSPSRRRRIARGSGRKELDVSNMIGMFTQMRSRMRDMTKMMKMTGAQGQQQLELRMNQDCCSGAMQMTCAAFQFKVVVQGR